MIRWLFLLTVFAAIVGCKLTPDKFLTQEPISIKHERLFDYWTPVLKEVKFEVNTRGTPALSGVILLRYLIDSNGNIHDVEILQAVPDDSWNRTALKALENTRYKPAKDNTSARPVIVTQRMDFSIKSARQ